MALTPEMKAFADEMHQAMMNSAKLLADRVEKRIEHAENVTGRAIDGVTRQLDGVSRQVVLLQNGVAELQEEQKQQSKVLAIHTTQIAVINERLEQGEAKFAAHTDQIEALQKASNKQGLSMAHVLGALGAAGAGGGVITAAVMRLLH